MYRYIPPYHITDALSPCVVRNQDFPSCEVSFYLIFMLLPASPRSSTNDVWRGAWWRTSIVRLPHRWRVPDSFPLRLMLGSVHVSPKHGTGAQSFPSSDEGAYPPVRSFPFSFGGPKTDRGDGADRRYANISLIGTSA